MTPSETLFASRFRLADTLGTGGSARVVRARDAVGDRDVALKILHEHLRDDHELRDGFVAGARRAAAVRHDRLARILAFGIDDLSGRPWIAMSIVPGRTLADRVAHGPLGLVETVEVLAQVLDALGTVHAAGLVHRDLSPGNVMVHEGPDGGITATVLDLGLAEVTGRAAAFEGRDGTTLVEGSVDYMSPEQAMGADLDHAADIYQVGALGYLALTGTAPFPDLSPREAMEAHIGTLAPPVSALRPDAPRALDAIIARAMLKNPKDRFPSAYDMARALGQVRPRLYDIARHAERSEPTTVPRGVPSVPGRSPDEAVHGASVGGTIRVSSATGRTRLLLPFRPGEADAADAPTERISIARRRPSRTTRTGVASPRREGRRERRGAFVALLVVVVGGGVTAAVVGAIVTAPAPAVVAAPAVTTAAPAPQESREEDEPQRRDATTVVVPDVHGLSADEASAAIRRAGLTVGDIAQRDGVVARAAVLETDPAPGRHVAPGTAVALAIASGMNVVPDVLGLDGARAARALREAGFVPSSDPVPGRTGVSAMEPNAGERLELGSIVILATAPTPRPTPVMTPVPEPTSEPTSVPTIAPSPTSSPTSASHD